MLLTLLASVRFTSSVKSSRIRLILANPDGASMEILTADEVGTILKIMLADEWRRVLKHNHDILPHQVASFYA
jgi:hypothetical protein